MKFRKPDEGLSELLEETVSSFACQKRKMFGSPVYFVNGNMFAGVHQDSIFLRLSEKDRENIFKSNDEATQFEPLGGRVMREYMVIPDSIHDHPEEFNRWLGVSYDYVASLPPKKKKKKK